MAHTPGPWTIQAVRDKHIWIRGGKLVVAEIDGSNDPDDNRVEADAHLIAAAPELLAVVKMIEYGDPTPAVREQAQKAIAKAEGRQP